jgi:hypothetical protein
MESWGTIHAFVSVTFVASTWNLRAKEASE